MRRPEKEYGSEYRLWRYFYSSKRCDLDAAILEAIGYPDCSLSWVYPDEANDPNPTRIREPSLSHDERICPDRVRVQGSLASNGHGNQLGRDRMG